MPPKPPPMTRELTMSTPINSRSHSQMGVSPALSGHHYAYASPPHEIIVGKIRVGYDGITPVEVTPRQSQGTVLPPPPAQSLPVPPTTTATTASELPTAQYFQQRNHSTLQQQAHPLPPVGVMPTNLVNFDELKRIRRVGIGAQGEVFLYSHRTRQGEVYAVKKVPLQQHGAGAVRVTSSINSEIRNIFYCSYPQAVRLYNAYLRDNCLWLIMEYVNGGNLQDLLSFDLPSWMLNGNIGSPTLSSFTSSSPGSLHQLMMEGSNQLRTPPHFFHSSHPNNSISQQQLDALDASLRSTPSMMMMGGDQHQQCSSLPQQSSAATGGGAASVENNQKRHRQVPVDVASYIIDQLVQALSQLHQKRRLFDTDVRPKLLIHRDIKPANILLSESGDVKLADFGVATEADSLGAASFVGTKCYMAPERVCGSTYGPSSDIWSIGVILGQLLLGYFPYVLNPKKGPLALYRELTSSPIVLPPEVATAEAVDFLQSCLRPEANMRPAAKDLLEHPFLVQYRADGKARFAAFIESVSRERQMQLWEMQQNLMSQQQQQQQPEHFQQFEE